MRPDNELAQVPNGGAAVLTGIAVTEFTATSSPQVIKLGRLVFQTAVLPQDLHLAGSATVALRVQTTLPSATLTARLVDYGNQS